MVPIPGSDGANLPLCSGTEGVGGWGGAVQGGVNFTKTKMSVQHGCGLHSLI